MHADPLSWLHFGDLCMTEEGRDIPGGQLGPNRNGRKW